MPFDTEKAATTDPNERVPYAMYQSYPGSSHLVQFRSVDRVKLIQSIIEAPVREVAQHRNKNLVMKTPI